MIPILYILGGSMLITLMLVIYASITYKPIEEKNNLFDLWEDENSYS
jgi:hypothetical protein